MKTHTNHQIILRANCYLISVYFSWNVQGLLLWELLLLLGRILLPLLLLFSLEFFSYCYYYGSSSSYYYDPPLLLFLLIIFSLYTLLLLYPLVVLTYIYEAWICNFGSSSKYESKLTGLIDSLELFVLRQF